MKKQIYQYPFNGREEDEGKTFLSDKICHQVGKWNYKTGQILGTIKNKIIIDNKKTILSFALLFSVCFSLPSRSNARFSYPAHDINRPAKQRIFKPSYSKPDRIEFVQPTNVLPLCCYMKEDLQRKTSKQIAQDLRGGSLFTTAVILLVIVLVSNFLDIGPEAFHIANPQMGIHRPANGGIQHQRNQPRNTRSIHFLSKVTEQNPFGNYKNQVETFVKNGKLNLRSCYNEVFRRASELECNNFECTFERFKDLATENGLISTGSAREAITALEGEMLGLYENAARQYYGKGVFGPDFLVEGLGEFSHVTHLEVKNPVGSNIEKTSRGFSDLKMQGTTIGEKLSKQQSNWASETFRDKIDNLNRNAIFPKSSQNTLGLIDQFDVPLPEKLLIQSSIANQCTNLPNVIFINNDK